MNEREEILEKVSAVVKRVVTSYKGEFLEERHRFIEDVGADSLDRVTLLIELEDAFGITITEEEARRMATAAPSGSAAISKSKDAVP
jgi:acyl carrier protein